MNKFMTLIKAGAVALALALSSTVTSAAEDVPFVDGVVKDVRADGKLTIKHGPIPNLDMGNMTMVFNMADPKLVKGVKVGDKIKIQIEDVGGKLTVTGMKKDN